ncbi:kinesin-domain-containing protein [Scleroderma citrinum]
MTTRSKATVPATRASTRNKTPVPPPSPPPVLKALKGKASAQAETSKAKATAPRKPLVNRANAPDTKPAAPRNVAAGKNIVAKATTAEREPILAYLRIRPHLGDELVSMPYLEPLSDTSVRMTDPSSDAQGSSRLHYRASAIAPSSIYKFSHIFPPATAQEEFFSTTTLPLVHDLLNGQNGLLFAYGVTNSGKTYTIQGDSEPGSAGILPRTLDVLFNSIDGLHSDGRYRPVRLYGVEEADPSESAPPTGIVVPNKAALAEVLAEHLTTSSHSTSNTDPTVIKVDRNYEYSVWISYVEVYNEKVYDLLASVTEKEADSGYYQGQGTHPLLVTRKALMVKPSPSMDAADESGGSSGRYISGLKQFRVTDAAQAKELLRLGQLHRRVFGTLANSQSSRSHSMVTIRLLKGHRGEKDDPSSLQMSRLTIVDLAGSERAKNTQTSGDRLKEAGNINKSLMVLGQCMEVMRANQKRLAQSLAVPGRTDTRDVKMALAVVPFRHSKLTEILMDYFTGDGRVVMIVNVNPCDTGFEENSHVMKFSALAREVSTIVNNAPVPRLQASPTKLGSALHARQPPSGISRGVIRKVTISSAGPGKKVSETHLDILEEDEQSDENDSGSEDEPINPLVDALFDEIEDLRMRLYEAELRCAIVEAETREEVMKEMEERMREVERTYAQRLMSEVERNEQKMDAKIDMLHQAGLFGMRKKPSVLSESEIEDLDSFEEDHINDSIQDFTDSDNEFAMNTGPPSSPLHGKGKSSVPTKTMAKQLTSVPKPVKGTPEDAKDISDESESAIEEGEPLSIDDDDDYVPPTATKTMKSAQHTRHSKPAVTTATGKMQRSARSSSVSKLEQEMNVLKLADDVIPEADESVIIVPNRKARQATAEVGGQDIEYVPLKGETDTVKKKKR